MIKKSAFTVAKISVPVLLLLGCSGQPATQAPPEPASTPTIIASSDWAYDIENKNMVAGAADTIIVGTVLQQVEMLGTRQAPNPETQFEVEVNTVLKGDVSGSITVSQLGGYSTELDAVIMNGDDPLMSVGAAYVMALVFDPAVGWYTASPATNGIEQIPADQAETLDPAGTPRRGGTPEPVAVSEMRDAVVDQETPQAGE